MADERMSGLTPTQKDKEWYEKDHSWKRRPWRAPFDDFKMPPRVDDYTKLSMETLQEHQSIIDRCPYEPTWRGQYPDYKGNWKRRVFEKGIERVITPDSLDMFFDHCHAIRENDRKGNKRIYIGPDNFQPMGKIRYRSIARLTQNRQMWTSQYTGEARATGCQYLSNGEEDKTGYYC